jgi:hypothetical protein
VNTDELRRLNVVEELEAVPGKRDPIRFRGFHRLAGRRPRWATAREDEML